MAIDSVYARLAELAQLSQRVQAPGSAPTPSVPVGPGVVPPDGFEDLLAMLVSGAPLDQRALAALAGGPQSATLWPSSAGGSAGQRTLAIASNEVGHAEFPPGSNDGPRISEYRSAVNGAYHGAPWCAYFVSWAAANAGTPIGHDGGGLGSVAGVEQWARETGRLLPPGASPAPGDLVLYGHDHMGIVEAVHPDGSLTTVEGNHANAVSRVLRGAGEATGFVRL